MTRIENWLWEDFSEVDSTNNIAKLRSKNFDGQNIIFSASSQTSGRGRMGRKWISENGNLFMSQLFYLNVAISDLVFITSLSIAESIKELTSRRDISIKWPNDVLVSGGKISGILIETGENNTVIVGVGINLISSPQSKDILYPVANLQSLGKEIKREVFLQTYLKYFNSNLKECMHKGFLGIRQRWLGYAARLNKRIEIRQTGKEFAGIFKGIDEQGFLLLEHNQTIQKIAAGDVFFPKKDDE